MVAPVVLATVGTSGATAAGATAAGAAGAGAVGAGAGVGAMFAGMPLWAQMALGSVAKDEFIDKPKRKQQNIMRAQTQALSPWLKNGGDPAPFASSNVGDSIMQSAFTGLALQQNMDAAKSQDALSKAQIELLRSQTAARGNTGGGNPLKDNPLAGSQFDQLAQQQQQRPNAQNFYGTQQYGPSQNQGPSQFDFLAKQYGQR